MKEFLARKIKIFKWSVPVWAIAAAFLAVGAAAAFMNSYFASVEITAMDAPVGTWDNFQCTVLSGPGTVDTCLDNGDGTATVAVSGVDDDSVVEIKADYTTTEWHRVWVNQPDPLPTGISEILFNPTPDGYGVNNTSDTFKQEIHLADLTPSQVISAFSIGWEAEVYTP